MKSKEKSGFVKIFLDKATAALVLTWQTSGQKRTAKDQVNANAGIIHLDDEFTIGMHPEKDSARFFLAAPSRS